jgi:CarD family transcriptional regulator
MGFSIGDKIMHPKFGVGRITGESHRELVEGFEHYYVINVVGTGATAYVPVRKMDELGVRRVMSRDKLAQVFNTLRGTPSELSTDYKQRQMLVQEQLLTRRPIQVAEAVRDLTWHRIRKRLTQKDETLLNQGRELLASEMALATDTQIIDAEQTIETVLTVATTSERDGQAGLQETGANLVPTSDALVQKLLSGVAGDQGVSTFA